LNTIDKVSYDEALKVGFFNHYEEKLISKNKALLQTFQKEYDVLVMNERVDLGQYVVVGQSLGSAYGIEAVEIEVPLEDDELVEYFQDYTTVIRVDDNTLILGAF